MQLIVMTVALNVFVDPGVLTSITIELGDDCKTDLGSRESNVDPRAVGKVEYVLFTPQNLRKKEIRN